MTELLLIGRDGGTRNLNLNSLLNPEQWVIEVRGEAVGIASIIQMQFFPYLTLELVSR